MTHYECIAAARAWMQPEAHRALALAACLPAGALLGTLAAWLRLFKD
jgi:hypothetical protein